MHADDGALAGARVGILATDGFDEDELVEPRQAYANEGATTLIVSPKTGTIQGYRAEAKGDFVKVDMAIGDATSGEFDALLLPGGILNGDRMRLDPVVTTFVRSFAMSGKPIAAICHGIWLLVENGGVRGRKVTSCPSLRTDLKNAGAMWVDEKVVEDRNLVTSRSPDDIPPFIASSIALFAKRLDLSSKPPAIGGGPSSTE
jgi:protease I